MRFDGGQIDQSTKRAKRKMGRAGLFERVLPPVTFFCLGFLTHFSFFPPPEPSGPLGRCAPAVGVDADM